MPSSPYQLISGIVERIVALAPQSVLDVGMGSGKYGWLCREYLEMAHGHPRLRLDGIEAFAPNITDLHRMVYDEIYVGDALEIVPQLQRTYDVVLVIEMLEHLEPEQSTRLIKQLQAISRHVLISVPNRESPQQALYGNEHEIHRHQFTRAELWRLGFHAIASLGPSWVALYGPNVAWFDERPWWWKLLRPAGRLMSETRREHAAIWLHRVLKRR